MGAGTDQQRRWRDQKVISWGLRALVLLVPLAAAIATSSILSRTLPEPQSSGAALLWWITVLGSATLVMHLTDRIARKLLPLAVLLRLSLLFPDRAPSRVRVHRKAGSINRLAEAMEDAKTTGSDEDLAEAAERILALAARMNVHDRRTRGHAERVRAYTDLLAEEMDLQQHDRDRLRWAALLHDIGKLEVHSDILNKPGKPTDEEWAILRSHPSWGAEIVAPLADWLGDWVLAVEEHHEKYDGTGYPRGLAGEEISMAARIVAVTDVFDVITSPRSYKKAISGPAARAELARSAGNHFDPSVVRAFMNVSMGRLRWMMGPLSWLADFPFIGGISRLARDVVMFGGTATAVATLVFTGFITPRAVSTEAVAAEPVPVVTMVGAGTTPTATTRTPEGSTTPTQAEKLVATASTESTTTTGAVTTTVNVAPVANADEAATEEDIAVVIDVLGNDSDPNGDALVIVAFDPNSTTGGAVECVGTKCTYSPPAEYWGTDEFGYTVADGRGGSATAVVTVTVVSVNDAPSAVNDFASTPVDTSALVYVLSNDTDSEGEGRTIVAFDSVSSQGGAVACGTFCVYVPPSGFTGDDSFSYTIEDESGNSATGTVTIAVG